MFQRVFILVKAIQKKAKRVALAGLFAGLWVAPFGKSAALSGIYAVPKLEKFFIKAEPIEKRAVYSSANYFHPNPYKYKGEISYSEMKEDLENLFYLLKTSYGGYEIAVGRGLDLEKSTENILEKFKGSETIYSRDFAKAIQEELRGKVIDSHFQIYTGNFPSQWLGFSEHKNAYLSDYFVEAEKKASFLSDNSENPEVLLFPYYREGVLSYRAGVLSVEPVQKISVKTGGTTGGKDGGKTMEIPVKNYPVNNPSGFPYLKEKTTAFSAYIRLESFLDMNTKASEKTFEKFCSAGSRYRSMPNVILDLRTNQGGSHSYEDGFIGSFYFNDSIYENKAQKDIANYIYSRKMEEIYDGCFRLFSYAVAKDMYDLNYGIKLSKKEKNEKMIEADRQDLKNYSALLKKQEKSPEKIWSKIYSCEEPAGSSKKAALNAAYENYKSAFNGRMIILLDRNSCSASEEICLLAKEFFGKEKVILVGENSGGCIEYGATTDFYLPNSELSFHIPTSVCSPFMERLDSWHGEGNGIYPDIWSTDEDMAETLVNITKDEGLRGLGI